MNANQRSKANNQTNNGANEKWTPGAKGNTTSGPMDHTYPQGASQQQGGGEMGTQQSGTGAGTGSGQALPGGSMQTQQTGGSGPQQGITDSHQKQMEQRSGAYGQLEQPVGGRDEDSGASVPGNRQSGSTQDTERMNPGGLPRSPGNTGATDGPRTTHLTGAQNDADLQRTDIPGVHESNDLGGGYPRSPGGANKLAADEKMDDDTGFSNPGR